MMTVVGSVCERKTIEIFVIGRGSRGVQRMRIVTRREAGEVRVNESLVVTILGTFGTTIKLGFASSPSSKLGNDPIAALMEIHSDGRGYYRFSKNGDRSLVLELTKGRRVALNDSQELIVLEVRRAGVTLAVCGGRELGFQLLFSESAVMNKLSPIDVDEALGDNRLMNQLREEVGAAKTGAGE